MRGSANGQALIKVDIFIFPRNYCSRGISPEEAFANQCFTLVFSVVTRNEFVIAFVACPYLGKCEMLRVITSDYVVKHLTF